MKNNNIPFNDVNKEMLIRKYCQINKNIRTDKSYE